MEYIFGYLILCIAVGILASNRGHSGFVWFFFSLLISPLLACIIVLVMKKEDPNAPNSTTHMKCPECKENILIGARKCKHCGSVVSGPMTSS